MKVKIVKSKKFFFPLLMISLIFVLTTTGSCSNLSTASTSNNGAEKKIVRVAIATQDQTINTATGGAIIREARLLEKYLPKTGKYANTDYRIEWSSYTSGPPITNKMLAGQTDIGLMGDFPATINITTFQKKGNGVNTKVIATLAYSATGAGNAVVVPKDKPYQSLTDLKGKQISVPFGSAAHGMLLKALRDAGLNPDKDVTLLSQSPEVGGTSLQTGQIDAHADFVPYGELFPFRGFARKIFDGAETGIPTAHFVLVRSDFAKENPEFVVAYLKALLEANQMFRAHPEVISAKIEKWTGVDKEVNYMFLGPSGLQKLNPTISFTQVEALQNSVSTLQNLGKLDANINPKEATQWVDESYLRQAIKDLGLTYEQVVATAENYRINGKDSQTQEVINAPNMSAQLWVKGEDTIQNFASIKNMLTKLQKLKSQGKTIDVLFVYDRKNGWKLLAKNAFFVHSKDEISAFLLRQDAQQFANSASAKVASFDELAQMYAENQQNLSPVRS